MTHHKFGCHQLLVLKIIMENYSRFFEKNGKVMKGKHNDFIFDVERELIAMKICRGIKHLRKVIKNKHFRKEIATILSRNSIGIQTSFVMWNQNIPENNHDFVIIPQYDNDHENSGNYQRENINMNHSSHENDDQDIYTCGSLQFIQQDASILEESSLSIIEVSDDESPSDNYGETISKEESLSVIIVSDTENDQSMNQDATYSKDPQIPENSFDDTLDDTIIGAWSQISLNEAFIIPNHPCRPVDLDETIIDIEEDEKEKTPPMTHNNFKPLMKQSSCESIYYEDIGMSKYINDSE